MKTTMWERFFNWQSDMDWAWGPFVSLRPARNQAMRPWVWVRLFLVFTLIGLTLIGAVGLLCVAVPRIATFQHHRSPIWFTTACEIVWSVLADPAAQRELAGLMLSLPALFFLFCLPFHWAWNRRAGRLAAQTEPTIVDRGVWPPAPQKK